MCSCEIIRLIFVSGVRDQHVSSRDEIRAGENEPDPVSHKKLATSCLHKIKSFEIRVAENESEVKRYQRAVKSKSEIKRYKNFQGHIKSEMR